MSDGYSVQETEHCIGPVKHKQSLTKMSPLLLWSQWSCKKVSWQTSDRHFKDIRHEDQFSQANSLHISIDLYNSRILMCDLPDLMGFWKSKFPEAEEAHFSFHLPATNDAKNFSLTK